MIETNIDLTQNNHEQEVEIDGPAVNLASETAFIINRVYNLCCGCSPSMGKEYKRELQKLLKEATPFRVEGRSPGNLPQGKRVSVWPRLVSSRESPADK